MSDKALVELKNISKNFPGVRALDNVCFTLQKGTVHGIAGENGAGKSTLMKILSGSYTSYDGQIFLNGKVTRFKNQREALDAGISIVHQELNPIPELTIAENIFIGREPEKMKGIIDHKKRSQLAADYLSFLGLDYNPNTKIGQLSVAQKQMVEIIKAISRNALVIIMDEPSSALTTVETQQLFKQINRLKNEGIAIIYITHKLEEIFEVCDMCTVLRDGKHIDTFRTKDITTDQVISMMVGRDIEDIYPKLDEPLEEIALKVNNYSSKGVFHDISFSVKKGEVLGIAGMMGAGRTEIVRSLFGLDPHTTGILTLENKSLTVNKPQDAIKAGIGMITEDRTDGFIAARSVADNIVLPNCDTFAPGIFLKNKLIRTIVTQICEKISIKTPGIDTLVMNLSGGNQQKVVLAKWLVREMKVLIMDEPTRGIDVGAKQEIYELIRQFTQAGMAIILISSEMPELIAMSHRIIVLSGGRIVGELSKSDVSQDAIMKTIINGGK